MWNKRLVSLDAIKSSDRDAYLIDYGPLKSIKNTKLRDKLRQIVLEKDGLLTQKERLSLQYHIYEGKKLKLCAALLHISSSNVQKHIKKAIKKLQIYFNS